MRDTPRAAADVAVVVVLLLLPLLRCDAPAAGERVALQFAVFNWDPKWSS